MRWARAQAPVLVFFCHWLVAFFFAINDLYSAQKKIKVVEY